MIDTLRRLVESLERLPARQQEEAARRIEPIVEELADAEWDTLLATPESLAYLDELAERLNRNVMRACSSTWMRL